MSLQDHAGAGPWCRILVQDLGAVPRFLDKHDEVRHLAQLIFHGVVQPVLKTAHLQDE